MKQLYKKVLIVLLYLFNFIVYYCVLFTCTIMALKITLSYEMIKRILYSVVSHYIVVKIYILPFKQYV